MGNKIQIKETDRVMYSKQVLDIKNQLNYFNSYTI